ncbi:MAG: hypothetical protein QOH55_1810 [Microbacteriaceae bacterium]|nr:hypothetical protein [Microbacteriaceae bacterium]
MSSTTWREARARYAALTRSRTADDPELLEALRELKQLHASEKVIEAVKAAPPLTDEQRNRIAAILNGGGVA